MGLSYKSVLPFPPEEIFAWHTRPGALRRLLPPWLPVRVLEEASSLRDGRAVLQLPLGLRLVAQHRPDGYQEGYSFVDEVTSPPFSLSGWRHTRLFSAATASTSATTDDLGEGGRGGDGGSLVEDRVQTYLPANMLRATFSYRHRQLAGDLAAHAEAARVHGGGQRSWPMTVAITGSSGFIGSELAAFLSTGGHRVIRLVRRSPAGPLERQWDPAGPSPGTFAGVQAVVHLAGAPIAGRFSEAHKRDVRESRIGPTRLLAEAVARAAAAGDGPACFVSASAVGYYGYELTDDLLTEASPKGHGFLADLVEQWEEATSPAAGAGVRVVNVRTGLVLSPRGGILALLYPIFFAGMGAKLGNGRQWMSWIGIDDLLDVYLRALADPGASGPLNAVSPAPVTNTEFTRVLAGVLRRPALFSVPAALPSAVFGPEGAKEFALASQRVAPAKLERLGHHFRHPELVGALEHLLGRREK